MPKVNYTAPENSEPWERFTGESTQAFGAWLTYRDLPIGERSLSRLASDLGKSGTLVAGWSAQWGWQKRLDAWGKRIEREKEKAVLEAARGAGLRQAAQLETLSRVLFEPARVLLARMVAGRADFENWSTSDLLQFSLLAARAFPRLVVAERLVRGQPTDIIEHQDDEGRSHIPADEQWNADFYAALGELGVTPAEITGPPAIDGEAVEAE